MSVAEESLEDLKYAIEHVSSKQIAESRARRLVDCREKVDGGV